MNTSPLIEVLAAQERGEARGITSICSANTFVLDAAFAHAAANDLPLLIESTCNQVNQYGGYTGQTAFDFMHSLQALADRYQFPLRRLVVGGDHLGPNPWRNEPAEQAMEKSRVLVRDYVHAGYTKIHLDTSMKCGDDGGDHQPLATEIIAARAADLALVAEESYRNTDKAGPQLNYIIGTEVPAPGGVDDEEDILTVTTPQAAQETILTTKEAFLRLGLEEAWERVIAVVVQPGVEYGNDNLYDYDSAAVASLSRFIEGVEGVVYEAHSTDYQTKAALRELVRDHFAILKVGPALTFAFREAIFALADIEEAWLGGRSRVDLSNIRGIVDQAMLQNPVYWQPYYPGDEVQQHYARQYSLSDRIRYYWPVEMVDQALNRLLANLSVAPLPMPLLSQYMPYQFRAVRSGLLQNQVGQLIQFGITAVLNDYTYACGEHQTHAVN
jgi:D-tagatose-1,6-bisphosphate aldolase subunit GatZ/KbaZ